MPATKLDKVLVTCPRCGHQQPEPRSAFSTVCKKCGQHVRLQELLQPRRPARDSGPARRQVTCFECGAELEVAATAESTMCKRCSRYVDLKDYHITTAVSKNFKTKGAFVIEPKGYVFNTEILVGEAVIKGRLLGKIHVEGSLTIYSSASIKGTFTAGQLVIPAANVFQWKEPIRVQSAEIAGELAGQLQAKGTVRLKSSARFFGDIQAGNVAIEEGAVIVGAVHSGNRAAAR